MLFDVEADNGHSIIVYLVPDSGAAVPSVRVRGNGADLLDIEANDLRSHLVAAGRHTTGRCGFVIDEALVQGLPDVSDLEILDASTDTLVYRRRPPGAIDRKIFRMETHLLPLAALDAAMRPRFHYWYGGIDRLGRETSTQVFCLEASSLYVSGRLPYKAFEYHLTRGVSNVVVLRDPFLELAERLLVLKHVGARAEQMLGARDAMTFAATIAVLRDCDLRRESGVRHFFRKASDAALRDLSDPLVRQLACATPDERPGGASVSSALDALAMFEAIGMRADPAPFRQAFGELVEIDSESLPSLGEHPRVIDLGERLRRLPIVETCLEKDLEVFHLVDRAVTAAAA